MSAVHGVADNWKKVLWSLAKPAIVAMVVALLVSLGVQMTRSGPDLGAAGITHFSSLQVQGETYGVNGLRVAGNVTGTGASDTLTYANMAISKTLSSSSWIRSSNGLEVGGNLTGTSSSGRLDFATGNFTTTLAANTISATNDITALNSFVGYAWLQMYPCTAVTVVNTLPFTPTCSYQKLVATAWVSPSISVTGYGPGDRLTLQNISAFNIYFADASPFVLSAAHTMGISDVLELMFDGNNKWVELGWSDN